MYRWLAAFLLSALVVFTFSPNRLPAAEHEAEQDATAEKGAGHEEGETGKLGVQEGVFKGSLDLAIFTIVVFLLLMLVLGRLAWKPMLEGLQKREESIRSAVEDAQRARDEARQIRDQLHREMSSAQTKVQQLIDDGRRDAQRVHDDMLTQARKTIQEERDRLQREIEVARDQALHQIWSEAAQLATLVSSKAIRRQLTPDDHRQLVDEALAELRQAGPAVG